MTEAEARADLERMTAASAEPALTGAEVDRLVVKAKRADIEGRAPSDAGWVPTWDLDAAAAEGWRWKAAKVAGQFSFGADGQSFRRSEMHRSCLEMVRTFRRGASSAEIGMRSDA